MFVRNWVDAVGPSPINQKVQSVVIGAGGVFRPPARLGVQIFGAQYAVALGDLNTAGGDIQDIMGNLWSVGIALVMVTQALTVDEFTCEKVSRVGLLLLHWHQHLHRFRQPRAHRRAGGQLDFLALGRQHSACAADARTNCSTRSASRDAADHRAGACADRALLHVALRARRSFARDARGLNSVALPTHVDSVESKRDRGLSLHPSRLLRVDDRSGQLRPRGDDGRPGDDDRLGKLPSDLILDFALVRRDGGFERH